MRDTKLTSFKQLCHAYNFKFTYIRKTRKSLKEISLQILGYHRCSKVLEPIKIIKFVRYNDSQKP